MKSSLSRLPKSWQVIHAISRVTRSEILKDRVLYNILLVAILMLGVTLLASQLSFIQPYRIVLDFGATSVLFACVMVSLFLGASLVIKEFERRTIMVALSHPITRFQFLIGKYFGLAQVLVLNWAGLVAIMAVLYWWTARGMPEASPLTEPALVWSFIYILFESLLVAAIALMFSTFSTVSVSVMLTLGVLMLGHNLSQLLFLSVKAESEFLRGAILVITWLFPNFELYALKSQLTYGLPLATSTMVYTTLYSFSYLGFVLIAAGFMIRGRDR